MKFEEFWLKLMCKSRDETMPPSKIIYPDEPSINDRKVTENIYITKRVPISKIGHNHYSYFECSNYELSLTSIDESDSTEKCISFPHVMVEILWIRSKDVPLDSWWTELCTICKEYDWKNIPGSYNSEVLSKNCPSLALGLSDLIRYVGVTKRE